MTDMTTTPAAAPSGAGAPLEKRPLETYVPPAKPSLIGLSRAEIADRLGEIGVAPSQRKMRTQQLWHWMYFRGAKTFAEMTNVSKEMRAELEKHFTVDRPEVVAEQISNDGTRKWLLRLPSGDAFQKAHEVECVYIPETDRGTLCVSSQVGCTLNCSFCHTGTQRLVRNLTAGEIVGQVMVARDRLNDWADRETPLGNRLVTNVVMMGMGEPLYNFDAVRDALLIVSDNEGIGISRRRITLSTSGVVPNIVRAGEEIGVDAGDLAACGARRTAQRAGAAEPQISDCRIAAGLPRLSRRVERAPHHLRICDAQGRQRFARRCKTAGEAAQGHSGKDQSHSVQSRGRARVYECSDWDQIEKFSEYIFNAGYSSPVRTPRGRDILAACGQLKSETEKLSARERQALRAMAMTD